MPLIIELSHVDYPTHQVARYESDVEHFLQNEKRLSLVDSGRKINKAYMIQLIEQYGYAKIYDRKGNGIGGVYYADNLMTIDERNKEKEQNERYGI